MRNPVTDTDVLTFALAGCNAVEIAAYAGTSVEVAEARLERMLRKHRQAYLPKRGPFTQLSPAHYPMRATISLIED
jgi:hypothetical protein